MSAADRLADRINQVLDRLAEQEREWRPGWIAKRVHEGVWGEEGLPDEAPVIRHASYRYVRGRVTRICNKRTDPEPQDNGEQLTLPGWDHLQHYYSVQIGGEWRHLPVTKIPRGKLLEKAEELRKDARALLDHADEIERFVEQRKNTA